MGDRRMPCGRFANDDRERHIEQCDACQMYYLGYNAALLAAAKVCMDERVSNESAAVVESDAAYNRACKDCARAIERLKE